jgi:serine/threonine protein kinase
VTLTEHGFRELTRLAGASGERRAATRSGELVAETYRLLERIGSGGMGDVYAAEHVRLGRQFAVKLLRANDDAKATQRFRREANAIARIENEYVVSVVDCGLTSDEIPFMVMERLYGEDLRCLLAHASPLPIPRAVSLVCGACHGMAAVHRAGLVHRDLKPGNLFVTRRSTGEDWCKVLDFGVAKMGTSASTVEGALIGTVKYMAPEQLRDGASAGPSADIYALGAILYESLSGVALHSGASAQELMFKVMNEEPARLDELRRDVPTALADAVHRAIAKQADERFASVQDFGRALAPFSRSGGQAELVATETVAFETARRPGRLPSRALQPALAICIALAVVAWASRRAHDPKVEISAKTGALASRRSAEPSATPVSPGEVPPPSVATSPVSFVGPASAAAHSSSGMAAPFVGSKGPSPPRSLVSLPKARFDADNPYAH